MRFAPVRLFTAALAVLAPLALSAAPAAAQPRSAGRWMALDCANSSHGRDRADVMRLDVVSGAPTDAFQQLCMTVIPLPASAPYASLVVFQALGSYWCGTAGCTTHVYGRDRAGALHDIGAQETMTNSPDDQIRVDRARAFRGMPRLAIRTGGGGAGPGVAEWGWIPRLGRYSD